MNFMKQIAEDSDDCRHKVKVEAPRYDYQKGKWNPDWLGEGTYQKLAALIRVFESSRRSRRERLASTEIARLEWSPFNISFACGDPERQALHRPIAR